MTMGFWLFMLVMDLLIPVTVLIVGWAFVKHPPKTVNGAVGYRTRRSMRTPQTWLFAPRYCGRLWFWLGLAMLPLTVIPLLCVLHSGIETIGTVGGVVCGVQCVAMVGSILPVERALKRNFDDLGFPRR